MASVFDAAKYILQLIGKTDSLKLQRLLYFCQAFSLGWGDGELFPEDFQAGFAGPQCQEFLKRFDTWNVPLDLKDLPDADSNRLSELEKDSVETVLEFFGHKDIGDLNFLSQNEAPWLEAWQETRRQWRETGTTECAVISKESMQRFYEEFLGI